MKKPETLNKVNRKKQAAAYTRWGKPVDRFWSQVGRSNDSTICWLWAGQVTHKFGRTNWNGKYLEAHTVAYIISHGSIPEGMFINHSCNCRLCCNPNHLHLSPYKDSTLFKFWSKVIKPQSGNSCWSWQGGKSGNYGYFMWGGTDVKAHRVSYELAFSKVPKTVKVFQTCGNKLCVNPQHLELRTKEENTVKEFWVRADRSGGPDACYLWTGATAEGYGYLTWEGKRWKASRVAWTITYGPIPKGVLVCHRCDIRLCVNPSHLFLGTPADNAADMVSKGRQAKGEASNPLRGEANPSSKMTEEKVKKMRSLAAEGIPKAQLAKRFGIDQSTACDIVNCKTWKHV